MESKLSKALLVIYYFYYCYYHHHHYHHHHFRCYCITIMLVDRFGYRDDDQVSTFRDYHEDNVFQSMETIMTLVIDESEDISAELLCPVLDSVKKDEVEISFVWWLMSYAFSLDFYVVHQYLLFVSASISHGKELGREGA